MQLTRIKITLLCIAIAMLSVLHVVVLNIDSTEGDLLTDISDHIAKISSENVELSALVASSSSIAAVTEKAHRIGMITSLKVLSFTSAQPLAYTQDSTP